MVIVLLVAFIGTEGMLLRQRKMATLASTLLLGLILWGKVATDLVKTPPPDTAVLLSEFALVLLLLESSTLVLKFEESYRALELKSDETSQALRERLGLWVWSQFSRQTKLVAATIILSVALLPLAGITSIPDNQLPLSAALVLAAVLILLFLVTQGREPEEHPG